MAIGCKQWGTWDSWHQVLTLSPWPTTNNPEAAATEAVTAGTQLCTVTQRGGHKTLCRADSKPVADHN